MNAAMWQSMRSELHCRIATSIDSETSQTADLEMRQQEGETFTAIYFCLFQYLLSNHNVAQSNDRALDTWQTSNARQEGNWPQMTERHSDRINGRALPRV